ncbi:hypothetical protein W02_09500 [Nitrospira sp. KM1]|uniref:hypothetical protein n=1 Tax=Nitrospira sp. KM1 TaxID=1936990 RepID=UPI0013A70F40|nr:hypothetical protein [Nitrospira sp. KM1]BCA53810.1 hypothetical protein W02_09500 [Nitrospira sp. KM1]
MHVRCLFGLMLLNSVMGVASVQADESVETAAMCREIEHLMNAINRETRTSCSPAALHGNLNVILVSDKPIFAVETSKKTWLTMTVGAVANVTTAHGKIKSSDVIVTDKNLLKKGVGYRYPVALAKTLQQRTKGHLIGLEELYQQLAAELTTTSIPRK